MHSPYSLHDHNKAWVAPGPLAGAAETPQLLQNTHDLPTDIVDFGGFDSSIILI